MTEDDDLERLLAEARALAPALAPDLMARILADARAVAEEREAEARRAAGRPGGPPTAGWRGWLAALGGWPVMGSLAASAVAGVWIGAAPPAALADVFWGEGVSVAVGADDDPLALLGG